MRISGILSLVLFLVLSPHLHKFCAQTTEFTYQGDLTSSGVPANGTYDFEFALFDALANGNQTGPTLTRSGVAIAEGRFSVTLDFGNQFPGAARFLEIRVRLSGQPSLTTLTPRQPLLSAPYSVRSTASETANSSVTAQNALAVGGISPGQLTITTDPRLSDARAPLPGSGNYIQNTTNQQPNSSFNISGNGVIAGNLGLGTNSLSHKLNVNGNGVFTGSATALSFLSNTTVSATSYLIGSDRVFAAQNLNTSAGIGSGGVSAGQRNTFVGAFAGSTSAAGADDNSFFGQISGTNITSGDHNSFFGSETGPQNTSGGNNTFIGYRAGLANIAGSDNTFAGSGAGESNTTISGSSGNNNTYIGRNAGNLTTTGIRNTAVGAFAFSGNLTGSNNTVMGRSAGAVNTGNDNTFFGTFAGALNSTGVSNTFIGRNAGNTNTTGSNNTTLGFNSDIETEDLTFATAIGAGATVGVSNSIVLGRNDGSDFVRIPGFLRLETLSSFNGSTPLCLNFASHIAQCTSSLQTAEKSNVADLSTGLGLVRQLRPVSFGWKSNGRKDFGLIAEEVAKVEPRLVTQKGNGEVEGIRYELVGVLLINAVKEQQAVIESQKTEIETLRKTLDSQQKQIDLLIERAKEQGRLIEKLKALVCSLGSDANECGQDE